MNAKNKELHEAKMHGFFVGSFFGIAVTLFLIVFFVAV